MIAKVCNRNHHAGCIATTVRGSHDMLCYVLHPRKGRDSSLFTGRPCI